jgi:hypothetical protein
MGGVAGIGRSGLPGPFARLSPRGAHRWGPPADPPAPFRRALDSLRRRLVAPALAAEGLSDPAGEAVSEAVVLRFRR